MFRKAVSFLLVNWPVPLCPVGQLFFVFFFIRKYLLAMKENDFVTQIDLLEKTYLSDKSQKLKLANWSARCHNF